ncbi:MAG: hypothetical protein ACUVRF_04830 [Desulfotomaculales bacterium]
MLPLRWRLTLTYTGVLALTLVVFSVALYGGLQQYLLRQTDRALALRAADIAYQLNTPRTHGWRRNMMLPEISVFVNPGTYLQIVDAAGEVVARSANLGTESLPVLPGTLELAAKNGAFFPTVDADGEKLHLYNLSLTAGDRFAGLLQVGQSLAPINNMLFRLAQVLFFVGLAVTALAAGLGYYLAQAWHPWST